MTAQYNLGQLYARGEGCPEHAEAARWYRGRGQGSRAQYNLGVLYDCGEGVPQNHAEAARWYRMAAEQGNSLRGQAIGLVARHV